MTTAIELWSGSWEPTTTAIPTQREYEQREAQMFADHLHMIEALPVYERKEAMAQFLDTCRTDAALVAERIAWLLGGNYGFGAYVASRQMVDSMRNPKPALFYLIASLEWQTGDYYAAKCWQALTEVERERLNELIGVEVELYHAEMIAERNPIGVVEEVIA